jgi:serine/threonine protein kinase
MVVLRADISPGSSRTAASEPGGHRRHPSDAAFVTLWPGETIGRYEIMSLLGCGALGPTYCARDRTLGRDVVVKEFLPWTLALRPDGVNVVAHPSSVADEFDWMRARFVEEGTRLRDLPPAPFVARAIDAFDANGTSCVVFNLVPGISLERRVRTGGVLRPATVERLLGSLVEALSHLHDQHLLHGDIRPANVMVDLNGRPTLIDFGNARAAMAQRLPELAPTRPLAYTAPELSLGKPATPATDIYALAATVHYAITGRAPPVAAERLQADRYEPLAGLALSGFAREMLTGIDRALTLHPGDRPQSIQILRALLRPRTSGRSGSAKSRFSRLWMAATAAVTPRR